MYMENKIKSKEEELGNDVSITRIWSITEYL